MKKLEHLATLKQVRLLVTKDLRKSINGLYRFESVLGKILLSLDKDDTDNDMWSIGKQYDKITRSICMHHWGNFGPLEYPNF